MTHFQHDKAIYFVTSRLFGSLPASVLQQLADAQAVALARIQAEALSKEERRMRIDKQHRRHFGQWDNWLDQVKEGSHYFNQNQIATLMMESVLYRNHTEYELICVTVMPNHTHLIFQVLKDGVPLHHTMGSLKKYVGLRANLLLDRQGAFWQDENWDRIVRNPAELARIIRYVLENPVKAGLVGDWTEGPYTYLSPDYQ